MAQLSHSLLGAPVEFETSSAPRDGVIVVVSLTNSGGLKFVVRENTTGQLVELPSHYLRLK